MASTKQNPKKGIIIQREQKLAVVDFDGTLFNSDECIRLAGIKLLGKPVPDEEYDGYPRALQRKIVEVAFTEFRDAATPNAAVIADVRARKLEGYRVVILTGRPQSVENATIVLLRKHEVPYDEVHHNPFTKIHTTAFKLLRLFEITPGYDNVVIYEDKRSNVDNFLELFPEQIYCEPGELRG